MKILVISDLHNDTSYCTAMMELFDREMFDKLYILGDIGRECIKLLNPISEKILAVKGNNDMTYDEEIARFPLPYITYDYQFGKLIVLTHGHYYSYYNYDQPFDVFLFGHTHKSIIMRDYKKRIVANPGSIALPRDYFHSYMTIDETGLKVIDFNSKEIITSSEF